MNVLKKYDSIVVFDVETTGLDPKNNRIIQLGGIRAEKDIEGNFKIVDRFNEFVNIGYKLDKVIIDLTKITDEILEKEGKSEKVVMKKFYDFIKGDNVLICAYNIQFDYNFIKYTSERLNMPMFTNHILDVMAVYRDYYAYPWKLKYAIEMFDIQIPNSHRADDDCEATFEVLLNLSDLYPVGEFVNKIGYLKKYPIPDELLIPKVSYYVQGYNGLKDFFRISNTKR